MCFALVHFQQKSRHDTSVIETWQGTTVKQLYTYVLSPTIIQTQNRIARKYFTYIYKPVKKTHVQNLSQLWTGFLCMKYNLVCDLFWPA